MGTEEVEEDTIGVVMDIIIRDRDTGVGEEEGIGKMVTGGEEDTVGEVVTEIEVTRIEVGMTAIITETDGEGVEDIEVEMMDTGETGRRGLHPLLLTGVTTLKVAVTATTTAGTIMRM